MLDLKKLDASASLIAGHYQLMLDAMSGHLALILDSHDPTAQVMRTKLRREVFAVTHAFSDIALTPSGTLASITREFMFAAIEDAGMNLSGPDSQYLSGHVADLTEALHVALRACVTNDAHAVERELRKVALQVDLLQAASGMNKVGALIRAKFGRIRNLKHIQTDRVGRKHLSANFVRSLVRLHLLSVYVESYLLILAKNGHDLAKTVYQDGRDGETFSITGATAGYPRYIELEGLFHPNSVASVEKA